jgi:hypothetical protein
MTVPGEPLDLGLDAARLVSIEHLLYQGKFALLRWALAVFPDDMLARTLSLPAGAQPARLLETFLELSARGELSEPMGAQAWANGLSSDGHRRNIPEEYKNSGVLDLLNCCIAPGWVHGIGGPRWETWDVRLRDNGAELVEAMQLAAHVRMAQAQGCGTGELQEPEVPQDIQEEARSVVLEVFRRHGQPVELEPLSAGDLTLLALDEEARVRTLGIVLGGTAPIAPTVATSPAARRSGVRRGQPLG